MSIEQRGLSPLDYRAGTLPGSPLRFRGPVDMPNGPVVVCLGGSETFGRFIRAPYPTRLDAALPMPVLNLGVVNSGLDVQTEDPAIAAATARADAVVLQITGAHNMTNRFYTVHPRRNDRFLRASSMLRTIYPEVDFTEFHFTRHLLGHLRDLSEDRFTIVQSELTAAWIARMRRLIDQTMAPVHLLWLSHRHPGDSGDDLVRSDPLFVTQGMLDAVSDRAASITMAVSKYASGAEATSGKVFAPEEETAARLLPGPETHDMAAKALIDQLR